MVLEGEFPRLIDEWQEVPAIWDVIRGKIDDIKRDKHIRSLARNEATTVTNSTLKKDIKDKDLDDIDIDTISDYLNLFNNMYITENISPFSSKLRLSLRVKQSEKRHFVDLSINMISPK